MNLKSDVILFFCVVLWATGSCADQTQIAQLPNQTAYPQLKKVTQTTYYSSTDFDVSTADFFYDDDQRLVSMITVNSGYQNEATFHYENQKITAVAYFENGSPDGSTTYYYNGALLDYTLSGAFQNEKTVYNYVNNQISAMTVFYPDGPDAEIVQSSTYSFENGNLTQELLQVNYNGNQLYKNRYAYGTGNNPMLGMNPYLRLTLQFEGFDGLSSNVPQTKTVLDPNNNAVVSEFYFEYVYNDDNFPISIKRFQSGNNFLISSTLLEYQ